MLPVRPTGVDPDPVRSPLTPACWAILSVAVPYGNLPGSLKTCFGNVHLGLVLLKIYTSNLSTDGVDGRQVIIHTEQCLQIKLTVLVGERRLCQWE